MIDESFVTLCKTTHPCIIHCELCVWSRSDYLVPPTNPRCNPEDRIIYLRIESMPQPNDSYPLLEMFGHARAR